MYAVPEERKGAANQVADEPRNDDENAGSTRLEGLDNVHGFDEMHPKHEVEQRLRPAACYQHGPEEMPARKNL
jgi:hypothetical protein